MALEFYNDNKGCRPTVKITDTGSMSTYQKLCYVLQIVEEIVEFINTFDGRVSALEAGKEDKINITTNRKLSPTGNFTGSIQNVDSRQVLSEIRDNRNKTNYLTQQFQDGQTGFVIDGGFFEDEGIDKNYDGGIF